MTCDRHSQLGRGLILIAALSLFAAGACHAQQPPLGPSSGHGYGKTVDPDGVPYTHAVVDQGAMTFSTVTVGTGSTAVLAAANVSPRTKLYLLNASGRPTGTVIDVWCNYGTPAVIGQGFILMGYGDRVTEDLPATIDQRALNCIATASTPINVGVVQQ